MSLDRGSKKTGKEFIEPSMFRAITAARIVTAGKDGDRREFDGEEIYEASAKRISGFFNGKNGEKVKAGLVRAAAESSNNAIDNISNREFN